MRALHYVAYVGFLFTLVGLVRAHRAATAPEATRGAKWSFAGLVVAFGAAVVGLLLRRSF